jgi:alpha-mannosidase
LLAVPACGAQPAAAPLLSVKPDDVLVTALKPSDDGRALIVRLFGASTKSRSATLKWGGAEPKAVSLSDTSERAGKKVGDRIEVPAGGLVSLRAGFK